MRKRESLDMHRVATFRDLQCEITEWRPAPKSGTRLLVAQDGEPRDREFGFFRYQSHRSGDSWDAVSLH